MHSYTWNDILNRKNSSFPKFKSIAIWLNYRLLEFSKWIKRLFNVLIWLAIYIQFRKYLVIMARAIKVINLSWKDMEWFTYLWLHFSQKWFSNNYVSNIKNTGDWCVKWWSINYQRNTHKATNIASNIIELS